MIEIAERAKPKSKNQVILEQWSSSLSLPSEEREGIKDVMRQIMEMFATGDLSQVSQIVSEDYRDHQGVGSVCKLGQDGFREIVQAARQSFRGLSVFFEDLVAEGDLVVARVRWRGKLLTAVEIDRVSIEMVRVFQGRAIEHWGADSQIEFRPLGY